MSGDYHLHADDHRDVRVHVVVYNDLPCPHCNETHSLIEMHNLTDGKVMLRTAPDAQAAKAFVEELQKQHEGPSLQG